MTHLQLRQAHGGKRVLPVFYSDNYLSLLPGEQRQISIEAPAAALDGDAPQLAVDGWNVKLDSAGDSQVPVVQNVDAVARSLPASTQPALTEDCIRLNCGGPRTVPIRFGQPVSAPGIFERDLLSRGGSTTSAANPIKIDVPDAAPLAVYQSARVGTTRYAIPVRPRLTYLVRLHFAEVDFDAGGRRFNVEINGQPMLRDFDIAAEVGRNCACVKTFTGVQADANGQLVIALRRGSAGEPILCGIEVVPGE
jgi:hypothetical protein